MFCFCFSSSVDLKTFIVANLTSVFCLLDVNLLDILLGTSVQLLVNAHMKLANHTKATHCI